MVLVRGKRGDASLDFNEAPTKRTDGWSYYTHIFREEFCNFGQLFPSSRALTSPLSPLPAHQPSRALPPPPPPPGVAPRAGEGARGRVRARRKACECQSPGHGSSVAEAPFRSGAGISCGLVSPRLYHASTRATRRPEPHGRLGRPRLAGSDRRLRPGFPCAIPFSPMEERVDGYGTMVMDCKSTIIGEQLENPSLRPYIIPINVL